MRRRTMAFAIATVKFSRTVPRSPENDQIKRQLTRAGTGGANYRASCRARSGAEWNARLGVAVEEADESDYWLTLMDECSIGEDTTRKSLRKQADELTRILAQSLETSRGRPPGKPGGRRDHPRRSSDPDRRGD